MSKYPLVNKGLSGYYKDIGAALSGARPEGNFGCWCYFDENLFCQEREGCENCMACSRFNTG